MKLAPPGAGVTALERLVGKHWYLRRACARLSWEEAPRELAAQAGVLDGLAAGIDEERLLRPVLVPRQMGLEDSSRFQSYAMVLEHLTIVGRAVQSIVVDLTHGRTPAIVIRVAEVKARGGQPLEEVRANYRAMIEAFTGAIPRDVGDRHSTARHPHPWIGQLSAYQWLCFAPLHQQLHIKQARRICRRLMVP
jgi:hypothetical protein